MILNENLSSLSVPAKSKSFATGHDKNLSDRPSYLGHQLEADPPTIDQFTKKVNETRETKQISRIYCVTIYFSTIFPFPQPEKVTSTYYQ